MNRNHTFISETVLAGDRYDSRPFSPCLDDFSRSAEKRGNGERSIIRQRKVNKPAVAGRSNEPIAPVRLNFQKVEDIEAESSHSSEIKGEEDRVQKVQFALSPIDENDGSAVHNTALTNDNMTHDPVKVDDLNFQEIEEAKLEVCHAIAFNRGENKIETLQCIDSAALSAHLLTDGNVCKLPNFTCNDEDMTLSLRNGDAHSFHEATEIRRLECFNLSETDGEQNKLKKVQCIDSISLATQSPIRDNTGCKISATDLNNDEITQASQQEGDLSVPNLIGEEQSLLPSPSRKLSHCAEASNISDMSNEISLLMHAISGTKLLPSPDNNSVAETESSINSKDDSNGSTVLTIDDTDQGRLYVLDTDESLPQTSLPILFLKMWAHSTVTLFCFLLKLPLFILVLSFKVTALTAGLYMVLFLLFADDELESAPWNSHTQLFNKPGIC